MEVAGKVRMQGRPPLCSSQQPGTCSSAAWTGQALLFSPGEGVIFREAHGWHRVPCVLWGSDGDSDPPHKEAADLDGVYFQPQHFPASQPRRGAGLP